MPRAAVALASTNTPVASPRSRRSLSLRPRRLHLVLIGIAIFGVWLVVVFAGSIADIDSATARQQQVTQEANAMQMRLDEDKQELQIVQTDAFQKIQARAYGLGAAGEVVFALPSDAPSPPPITPLGASGAASSSGSAADKAQTPLDAWLNLLFGN